MNKIIYGLLGLAFMGMTVFAFARETTGWKAPEETQKMKNPINATKVHSNRKRDLRGEVCPVPW